MKTITMTNTFYFLLVIVIIRVSTPISRVVIIILHDGAPRTTRGNKGDTRGNEKRKKRWKTEVKTTNKSSEPDKVFEVRNSTKTTRG